MRSETGQLCNMKKSKADDLFIFLYQEDFDGKAV